MRTFSDLKKETKIHLIGIGGISMSGIAKWLLENGYKVSGSDINKSDMVLGLERLGAKIYIGHREENVLDANLVIYTSAIQDDNLEILKAKKLKIPLIKRSRFLGEIINLHKNKIGISGCHGKTTVTAMLTHAFNDGGLNPTCFIGGEDKVYSNFVSGKKEYAIFEACEFRKNFLDLKTDIAVVLNIYNDHLDSFSCFDDLVKTYNDFSKNAILVYNADDKHCKKLNNLSAISFGIENDAMYMAKNIKESDGKYSFNLYEYGKNLGKVELTVVGKHNIYNALATIVVARKYGLSFDKIKKSLKTFTGVKRRNEFLGEFKGKKFYADYAHHPTELEATLKNLKEDFLIVFQPHTYSRTKLLMDEFVRVLKNKDLIIYKTYSAREMFDLEGSAYALRKNLTGSFYAEDKEALKKLITNSNKKSVMFLGAGDIYDIAKEIINER